MRKSIFATLLLIFVSVISLVGCNPYKGYNMTLSTNSIDLYMELEGDGTTYAREAVEFTATIKGGKKGVKRNVVLPQSSNVVDLEILTTNDGVTKIKATAKREGSEVIVIRSAEGNLEQKLNVSVGIRVNDMYFVDSDQMAIEAGGTLDMAANSHGFVTFYPSSTTQKNVKYEVVEEDGKSGYAYFVGSVLHAAEIPATGDEIYPTIDGKRYITVKATNLDNPDIVTTTTINVVKIVRNSTITINGEKEGSITEIQLTPNARGEYEILLAPESIGGVAVENQYASHRTLKISMGDSSIEHQDYQINFNRTNLSNTDPNTGLVGFEYDSSSSGAASSSFGFVLTGVTPSVVRQTIYIDHKKYVGQFTQAITFVVKTENIPTLSGLRLNDKKLTEYTTANPFVVFNGYASANSKFGSTLFQIADVNTLKNTNQSKFKVGFDYNAFGYESNQIDLKNISGQSVINTDNDITNNESLYIKHNYDFVNDGVDEVLNVTFSYNLCPSNGNIDDYDTYSVQYQIPVELKIGVTEEEVNSLAYNYYISSSNRTPQTMLVLNSKLVASEQVSRIYLSNDLVEVSYYNNLINIVSTSPSNQGTTNMVIYFENGYVSKEMIITTYVPIAYEPGDLLYLTIDEDAVFAVGKLDVDAASGELFYSTDSYSEYDINSEFYYQTFTDLIIPTNAEIKLDIWNMYKDNGWKVVNINQSVLSSSVAGYEVKWSNGTLTTGNVTTGRGAGNVPVAVELHLTFNGYEEGDNITTRNTRTIDHIINLQIYEQVTDLTIRGTYEDEAGNRQGWETEVLYDFNTTGSKVNVNDPVYPTSLLVPNIIPNQEDENSYGLINTEFYIQNSQQIIKTYNGNGSERIEVTLGDIASIVDVEIEEGVTQKAINVELDPYILSRLGDILNWNEQQIIKDIFTNAFTKTNGIECVVVGYVNQFGIKTFASRTFTLKYATKVEKVLTKTLGETGVYFEYRNGKISSDSIQVPYTIYPSNATNKAVDVYFVNEAGEKLGDNSNYRATVRYTATGGIVTITFAEGVDFNDNLDPEYLVINPYDNTKLIGEDEVLQSNKVPAKVLISYGNGTETNKFQIRSIRDIEVMLRDTESYYYQLANDISATGYKVSSEELISKLSGKFTTTIDGVTTDRYFAINGLTINETISAKRSFYNFGLFGLINIEGEVTDLRISDASLNITIAEGYSDTSNTLNAGILAGKSYGTVTNCQVTGSVNIVAYGTFVNINAGGMVGMIADKDDASNTLSTPFITGNYVGGNSTNFGNANSNVGVVVQTDNSYNYNVGVLIGKADLHNTTEIYNFNDLSVVGSAKVVDTNQNLLNASVGGVLGYAHNTNVRNTNVITSLQGGYVGGVVGTMMYGYINNTSVEFSYSSSLKNSLTATTAIGGLIGQSLVDGDNRNINIVESYVRSYTTRDIDDTYNGSLILLEDGEYAGGLVGYVDSQLVIRRSYFDADLNVMGEADTNESKDASLGTDGIAQVAGFIGANPNKSIAVNDSYAKGRIKVGSGNFGIVSGSETKGTKQLPSEIAQVTYDFAGSISDKVRAYSEGDRIEFTTSKTSIGITYEQNDEVLLPNSSTIAQSYVAINNQIYAIMGDSSSKYSYRDAISTTKTTKINLTAAGEDNSIKYYMVEITDISVTTTTSGTTKLIKNYKQEYEITNSDNYRNQLLIGLKDMGYIYEEEVDGVTKYFGEFNLIAVDATTIKTDYLFVNDGVNAPQLEEEGYWDGGYNIDGTFTNFVAKDDEGNDVNVTKDMADAQLVAIYQCFHEDFTSIDNSFDFALAHCTNVVPNDSKIANEISNHIGFYPLFDTDSTADTYDIFKSYNFAITSGIVDKSAIFSMVLKDTKGNQFGTINSIYPPNITVQDNFDWAVIDKVNDGLPIILKFVNTDNILYQALYSALPEISGVVLEYDVTNVDYFDNGKYEKQPFFKVDNDELVLTYGQNSANTYELFVGDGDTVPTTGSVIQIDVKTKELTGILGNYFIELITKNEISITSSNTKVVKIDNGKLVTTGLGKSVIRISSLVDDGLFVDIQVSVVGDFTHFELTDEDGTSAYAMFVNDELSLYPKLNVKYLTAANAVETSGNTNAGLIVKLNEINATKEAQISINGNDIDTLDYEYYFDNFNAFNIKGISEGEVSLNIIPFIYVDDNMTFAQDYVDAEGVSHKIIVLEYLQTNATINVTARAKSIIIDGQNSSTRTPDSVVDIDVTVQSYTQEENVEFLYVDVYVGNDKIADHIDVGTWINMGLDAHDKYLLDVTDNGRTVTSQVDAEGVTIYTITYHLSVNMSQLKYYQSIANSVGYVNPLTGPIEYKFVFSPKTNENLSATYNYTLVPNTLSKFDISYYPGSELSTNGALNPQEVKSTKIVPGREGLLKITPQKMYSNVNFVEITALDQFNNLILTQVGNNNGSYTPLTSPATTIPYGLRLWNLSNDVGTYDNTYYVKLLTSSTMPQGTNVRLQVVGKDIYGQEIYSQIITLTTEYLPEITAQIRVEDDLYDSFNEVAWATTEHIKFFSQYIDGGVNVGIVGEDGDPVYDDSIYVATKSGSTYTRATKLFNGEDYYVVVNENCTMQHYTITFSGTREINGILEVTSTSIVVQVVYVKIGNVTMQGNIEINGTREIMILPVGETTSVGINVVSTSGRETNYPAVKDYLNLLSNMFSAKTAYSTILPQGTSFQLDATNIKPHTNPYYLVLASNESENLQNGYEGNFEVRYVDTMEDGKQVQYYSFKAVNISTSHLYVELEYYFDENGYIQVFDRNQDTRESKYNYYVITHYFDLKITDSSTEDRPIPVSTQEQFEQMQAGSNYILINDITLTNWTPMPLNVASLDGNSYKIILQSFNIDEIGTTAEVGLFKTIGGTTFEDGSITIVKNLTLDLCQFYANDENANCDLTKVTNLTFGFFAAQNNGTITNCHVINTSETLKTIKINTHQNAVGTTAYSAQVAGFVVNNSGSISNSFVGTSYDGTITLANPAASNPSSKPVPVRTYPFKLEAGQKVAGFVINNSSNGIISNSYVKGLAITNLTQKEAGSSLAGFAVTNGGKIYGCFVEGNNVENFRADASQIGNTLTSVGTVAGFVHNNSESGLIENAYSKIAIKVNSVNTGGFVYTNAGAIRNAYTTTINVNNAGGSSSWAHGPFVGLAWDSNNNPQYGKLEHCYYLVLDDEFGIGEGNDDAEILATIDPAKAISSYSLATGRTIEQVNFQHTDSFEGFSITNAERAKEDFLWFMNSSATTTSQIVGPELIQATTEYVSFRQYGGPKTVDSALSDGSTEYHDYTWFTNYNIGSKDNPIIVNTATAFIKNIVNNSRTLTIDENNHLVLFGASNSNDNSVYAPEYIRVVSDINLTEQALNTKYYNASQTRKFALNEVIFLGQLEGNGMTISGINLTNSSTTVVENYGLFNQIGVSEAQKQTTLSNGIQLSAYAQKNPRIFNLNFEYEEISYPSAQKVGILAGSIYNATLRMINVSGPEEEKEENLSVITGANLVGGLAGLIAGSQTNIADVTMKNIRVNVDTNTLVNVGIDDINYSGYYDEYSDINTGASASSTTIDVDGDIVNNIGSISYAGAVAGAILTNNYKALDVVRGTDSERKTLAQYISGADYGFDASYKNPHANTEKFRFANGTIKNITVTGNIDVTADQAGGMFGYMGYNTHIMDCKVVIQEYVDDENSFDYYQHIYGYNRAGGIVAEMNNAVLERVEVVQDEITQSQVDKAINNTTPDNISKTDLFTSSNPVSKSVSLVIGGIAGYSKDSIIVDSFNKINVVNINAKVAGGLIGNAQAFNYIGYSFVTGDVLAKEVIGGLIGLYTYSDYSLYLQQVFALNRWGTDVDGTNITTILQNNNYSVYGDLYGALDEEDAIPEDIALVLPEIGNMYNDHNDDNAYGDNIQPALTNLPFVYVGSVIGKATLLPGEYSTRSTAMISIADDGLITFWTTDNGETYQEFDPSSNNATYVEQFGELLKTYTGNKYVKSLFVNNGETPNSISLPLYINNDGVIEDTQLTEHYFDTVSQKVLDKTVWYNKFNYNVISTTYSSLSEVVTGNVSNMVYRPESFVLNNNNLQTLYNNKSGEEPLGYKWSTYNGATYTDGNISTQKNTQNSENIITYPSILGKQNYLEKITGYYYNNAVGGDNERCIFNNEFNTTYGFTKITDNSGALNSSQTWYLSSTPGTYLPAFSYGRESSFEEIKDDTELFNMFSEDSNGKFFVLQSATKISLTSTNPQQFNAPFMGVLIAGEGNTITITEDLTATLLANIRNATFVGINFVFNLKSATSYFNQDYNLMSFGLLARNIQNTIFTNCTFTVNTNGRDFSIGNTDGNKKQINNAGLIFGEGYGVALNGCTFILNHTGTMEYIVPNAGNYGLFAGKLDNSAVNDFDYSISNVRYTLTDSITPTVTNLNIGVLFGALTNNTSVTDLNATKSITMDVEGSAQVGINADAGGDGKLNIGMVAGYTNNSTLNSVNAYVSALNVGASVKLAAGVQGSCSMNIGTAVGFAMESTITDVKTFNTTVNEIDVTSTITDTTIPTDIGGLVGKLDLSTITYNSLTEVPTDISVKSLGGDVRVGGIVGSTNTTHNKDERRATISNITYLGDIELKSEVTHYIGGVVGYAKHANLQTLATFGKITAKVDANGYVGGLAGYMDIPNSGNEAEIADVMTAGVIEFRLQNNTLKRTGGFVGSVDNSKNLTIDNCYSYTWLDYDVEDLNFDYLVDYFDIVCPSNNKALANVKYINEMMPTRGPSSAASYAGTGFDYYTRYNPVAKYLTAVPSQFKMATMVNVITLNSYVKNSTGHNSATLFSPTETTSIGTTAGVYLLTQTCTINSSFTIPKHTLYVGKPQTIRPNVTDKTSYISLQANNVVDGTNNLWYPVIVMGKNATLTNNGMFSHVGFRVYNSANAENQYSLFTKNNGNLYNLAVFGQFAGTGLSNFATVVITNNGSIAKVNASVTTLHKSTSGADNGKYSVNFSFSGLVNTNNGSIDTVVSTSGGIYADMFNAGYTHAGIVITNQGLIRDTLYGGVIKYNNSTTPDKYSGITVINTMVKNYKGTNTKKYQDVLSSDANNKFKFYTNTSQSVYELSTWATMHDYNFGVPFVRSAPVAPTVADANINLYNYPDDISNEYVYVRSLQDVLKSNISISHSSDDPSSLSYYWMVTPSENVGQKYYHLTHDLYIGDYTGTYVDATSSASYHSRPNLQFNNSLGVIGTSLESSFNYKLSGAKSTDNSSTTKLISSLINSTKLLKNITIEQFNVVSSDTNPCFIGDVVGSTSTTDPMISEVYINNITIKASSESSINLGGLIKNAREGKVIGLFVDNFTFAADSENSQTATQVGTIGSASNIQIEGSEFNNININANGKLTNLTKAALGVGVVSKSAEINDLCVDGTIKAFRNFGGLVGNIEGKSSTNKSTISDCFVGASGRPSTIEPINVGVNTNVGGLVGNMTYVTAKNSYVFANINIKFGNYTASNKSKFCIGGLVGNANTSVIQSNTYTGTITLNNVPRYTSIDGSEQTINVDKDHDGLKAIDPDLDIKVGFADEYTYCVADIKSSQDDMKGKKSGTTLKIDIISKGQAYFEYPVQDIAISYSVAQAITCTDTNSVGSISTISLTQTNLNMDDPTSGVVGFLMIEADNVSGDIPWSWWSNQTSYHYIVGGGPGHSGGYRLWNDSYYNGLDYCQNIKVVAGKCANIILNSNYEANPDFKQGTTRSTVATYRYWGYAHRSYDSQAEVCDACTQHLGQTNNPLRHYYKVTKETIRDAIFYGVGGDKKHTSSGMLTHNLCRIKTKGFAVIEKVKL